MGGFGALKYAGQHGDTFFAVGSFSGAVNLQYEPFQDTISNSMWVFCAAVGDTGLADPAYRVTFPPSPPEDEETLRLLNLFGPPDTSGNWPTHDPSAMVSKYAGIKLALYSGRSLNPFDGGESDIAAMNDPLHTKLKNADVPHRYCSGFGTHSFAYWRNDLVDFLDFAEGKSQCNVSPCRCTENSGWTVQP